MSTDKSIAAQTAAKAAGDLFSGTGDTDGAMNAMQRFFNGVMALGGDPDQFAQAQQNLNQGGVQSTVVRDLTSEDARWRDALVDNPGDWYNNIGDSRATSGGGVGPDFKFKNDAADVTPLWLNGKYGPAPAWVFEKLGRPFPGSPQAAPVPQPAPTSGAPVSTPVPF